MHVFKTGPTSLSLLPLLLLLTTGGVAAQEQRAAERATPKPVSSGRPTEIHMKRAGSTALDLRLLPQTPPEKMERPELEEPEVNPVALPGGPAVSAPVIPGPTVPAPSPSASFDGLDFATWGAGHPPDTNGDVGPTYYIQAVNTSIGIYLKTGGAPVAAFTFNTFMSQGAFGNLCDTNNAGDPVVLYDTFEDRWVISDLAFTVSGGNPVAPAFQCLAVSKTGDPVSGGWNFYSINVAGGLGDYPKFGIWPDGIYMSANIFGFGGGSFMNPRVYAFNKAQMYAGSPTVQVVSFDAPAAEFALLPANARLQTGTPPPGSPNYYAVVWQFLNVVSVYKFHVDWNSISTSTFTGPFTSLTATSWSQFTGTNADVPSPANSLDTLYPRLMMQNQYTNIGGVESLWDGHTVGASGTTSAQTAVRYYQVKVTGGTVEANASQAFTWSPDTTVHRFLPSVAVDRAGDMAIGYSGSSATLNPAIRYAGRLAADPVNTISQTETSLIEGTGSQSGTCGTTCVRWGDYSAMSLDPDGCTFWYTNEYYAVNGLNDLTRIGSFSFPSCTPAGAGGTLSGTVTATVGGAPISGATVAFGSRTATTNGSGQYSFSSIPAGTYPSIVVGASGYNSSTATSIVVTDGGTTVKDFSLSTAPASGCPTDTTQADFQTGVPNNVDLTTSPGNARLAANPPLLDQQNTTLGTQGAGFTNTTWLAQTFTVAVTGPVVRVDLNLFSLNCASVSMPNLTVSIRNASGNLPTGSDLAVATIPGFCNGAGGWFTATFASPATLTAGTQYAIVWRAAATIPTGTPTPGYFGTVSVGTGSTSLQNPYSGGRRASSANSGSTWTGASGNANNDHGFKTYVDQGLALSGNLISALKDANPPAGFTAIWSTLSWTAATPANTTLRFQVAASNSPYGPFNFVGPDGTAGTFFTTSGASLSQFNGKRYLKYEALFSTTNSAATPTLNDVTVCYSVVAPPDLSLTKSDGGASVAPGGTVAYTLTYANSGGQAATGVVLSETVPANTSFNSGASTAGWACTPNNNAGSTCTLAIGTVAASGGSSATFSVTVVNPVAAGVSLISNTASVADDGTHGADPTPGNNSASDTTPVAGAPDLSLIKSDGGASVSPGGTVAYTLSYANGGNRGASGVVLTETVPANTTFNAGASTAGWSCSPNGNAGSTCTLAIGGVAAGGGSSATFAVTVANPVPAGVSLIANTASIADDGTNGTDPNPGNNTGSDTTPVTGAPDLSLTKSDGGASVAPGATVAYTLSYSNSGNRGATGVVITETVPANTTFNAGASTAGWSCVPNGNAGSTCTLAIGSVAAGSGTLTATFAVTAVNPVPAGVSLISNTASIADNGTNGTDPTPGNNTGSDTTPLTGAPDLSLTKSDGGASVAPGGTVAYTLSYSNSGNRGASGVVITETVPANTTFNAGASTAGWSCTPNGNAGSTCTLVIGGLAAGGGSSVTFAVTAVNPIPAGVSLIANTASITDDGTNGTDPTPGNNTGSDTTPLTGAPDLSLTKSDGGASVAPGGTVAYTLTYSNSGNRGASGVVLTETVPANSTFNAGASTAGWSCSPSNNAGSVCTLAAGVIAAGSGAHTATFAVTVVNPVPAGTTQISNTASVSDDGTNGTDPTPGNNTGSDTTPLTGAPDLSLTKSDGGASVAPGGTVAYTLTYSNSGNRGASGVVITETVPANTTFNAGASTAGWVCLPNGNAGSTCTLTVGSLAAGSGPQTATFAVTVVNPVPAGVTLISNTASIADNGTNGTDPTPGNNIGSDTTPLTGAPDLSLTKSDGGVSVAPGATVAYTLSYSNSGNRGATGVVITETVPANTTFNAGASTAGWVCTPNGNPGSTCTLTVGSLVAGSGPQTATFAVTVVNPAPAGVSQISNTASIADDGTNGTDPTPGNNTGSDTTPLTGAPDLSLTKSDGGVSVAPGATVAYTLSYSNSGNRGASGVVITETVPANTTFNAGASTAGWACLPNGNAGSTCTLTVGTLAAGGGTQTATFAVTVVNPVPAGVSQISNTASIADNGTNGTDPTPGNNTGSDTTPLTGAPDLSLTKSDGGASVAPGGTVAYTLTYANSGNRGASGVVLTETVPANTTFAAGASTAGWSCTPNGNAGSTCTLAVGAVVAGSGNHTATFAVTVANPVPAGVSQISNTASIADDGTNGTDPTPGNNTGSDTTPLTGAPDLSLAKSDGGVSVAPGGTVAYTLSYANSGNRSATGVVITETVPANTAFNAGASTAGWACLPNGNAGSTCTLAVASLAPGSGTQTATFAVTVVNPVAAGVSQISNTASIADNGANGTDPNPGNNTGSDTTPLTGAPDLSLTKSDGGASVAPGATVAYTLTYANSGNRGAAAVVLTETVPASTTFNAGASTAGWSCAPNGNAGSTCTLAVGTVVAGSGNHTATFAVTAVNPVPAGVSQISNTASIADNGANGTDPTPANNTGSDTTPVTGAPDLSLTKSDGGVSVSPGGTVAYTLTYANAGNRGASGVVITETVPANSTFAAGASTAGWVCTPNGNAGSTCTLAIGAVVAGSGNHTATFAATVANPVPAGTTQIANTASIADDGANGTDPTPANNTGSDTTPVTAAPDLSLTKSDGGASVAPGGTVAYTLTWSNTGSTGATGVVITETVPANTTFAAGGSTAGWVCTPNGNAGSTCTLAIGAVAAGGGTHTATFAVTAVNPLPAGVTQISNTASIADDGANGADPTPANNTGSDTTPVTGAVDLSLTKSDGGASVAPGGTASYTLTYANGGNRGASGVVITETVPANTTFNAGASTAGWVCTPNGNAGSTCTLAIGAVVAGSGNHTAMFAVTVANPVPAGVTQISNTASIADDGANGTDPTPGNNTGSDTTPVTGAAPDLSLTKSDGGASAVPGSGISYTLTYTNTGSRGATGVVLTETVPANTTFNAGSSTAGWSCTPNGNAGSTCTLAIGAVAAGDGNHTATFAVTVANPVPAGVTQISNTASIADDGTNGADPTPGNNTASDTTPVTGAQPFTDYYSVQPCRLLDTRVAGSGGPVISGVPRVFQATGKCTIPADAIAISINLAVVTPSGDGYVTLYPGNGSAPLASTINFHLGGFTLSNNAFLQLATNGAGTIGAVSLVGGGGGVDVVIDVVGYFK